MLLNSRREAMEFVKENAAITDVIATNPYTVVRIQCPVSGQVYEAVGFSKCHPRDTYNHQLGIDIAYGRAVVSIAKALYGHVKLTHARLALSEQCLTEAV